MKESVPHLTFALLFTLVVVSIGMSVRPMIQLAAQLPAARGPSIHAGPRPPAATPRRLAVTPVPTATNPRTRAARLSS